MSPTVLVCGKLFDGVSEGLTGPAEILVESNRIASIGRSVNRSPGVQVIDLSDRTVSPGFIDTHVHLTMNAASLVQQTLESSASKALKGLSLAREYMSYGFTTLRDLGTADPEWPTVDLRNAINAGFVDGPRLIVAAHILSASAGHGDAYIDSAATDPAAELQKLGGASVILATAPSGKAMSALVGGLAVNGTMVVVGASMDPIEVAPNQLLFGKKGIKGWAGGIPTDSQDTLRFVEMTGVRPMIEKYPLAKAAEGYARMMSGKAEFRVVLTM